MQIHTGTHNGSHTPTLIGRGTSTRTQGGGVKNDRKCCAYTGAGPKVVGGNVAM